MRTETAMARMRASLALCVLMAMGALAGCQISPQTSAFGEITAAQEAWGDGVAHIGQVWALGGDYRQAAEDHVDALYGYGARAVLFKPTKAADQPFRLTRQEAVSYFVGGDPDFPEDTGFALQPWTAVRFENAGVRFEGRFALAMGRYYFATSDGAEVPVEYSFGYAQGKDGQWRIVLHHSSLPYAGGAH